MTMNRKIYRGAILRCTNGSHKGDYYLFTRTMGGRDKTLDFLGNEVPGMNGAMSYAFNLINLTGKDNAGKARQTEVERQFTSVFDGVNQGILLSEIEKHYGMSFEDVTDLASIKVEVKELLDEKRDENIAANCTLNMAASLLSMLPAFGGGKVVPLFAADGQTVMAYVVQ